MTVELLLMVGGLAVLDTLSPATLGVTVYLLLTEKARLASRLGIYLLTVAGFYFLVGVALMLGLDAVLARYADALDSLLQARAVSWTMLILGGSLFIASFYYPRRKSDTLPRPASQRKRAMVALGITTGLLEVATALPYFAAIGLMTTSHLAMVQWLPLMAAYNLIMVMPSLLLYAAHRIAGRAMGRPLERLQRKLSSYAGSAASWVMCIAGLILVFFSLDYL